MSRRPHDTAALFVRLPLKHARRLDLAAAALPARKKDLVMGLVERYVHPDTREGLDALRDLAGPGAGPRRVTVDLEHPGPVVGHHSFEPAPQPEVLTAAQAAELLAVEESALLELAAAGRLPGRLIGDHWRFSRRALLDWLGSGEQPQDAPPG